MSYSSILASAATAAEAILGPMTGPDADGTFVLSGTTYNGTMSIFDRVLVATATGYDEQRQIKIAATRAQFTTAPDPAGRPKFTARARTWVLTAVEPGAQYYILTGVAAS